MNKDLITVYTDGACSGNPGPGGWAYIVFQKIIVRKDSGGELKTTNNRMEMTAIINALKIFRKDSHIIVNTDSKYVINGITKWIISWKKNNWVGSNKKKVKNCDLWKELDYLKDRHEIKWQWIKGHSGECMNEMVDKMARKESEKLQNF